jgi:hypothetical protein
METNTQHETGRWLRHGAPRGHDETEIADGFPEPEGSLRLFNDPGNGAGFPG